MAEIVKKPMRYDATHKASGVVVRGALMFENSREARAVVQTEGLAIVSDKFLGTCVEFRKDVLELIENRTGPLHIRMKQGKVEIVNG